MDKIYIKYKGPVAALLLFILIWGVVSFINIPTGLFPDITFPKIKIIAEVGQQPIDKMKLSVTIPLENAIKKIPNLQMLRSTTTRGSCEISAFIDWNSDIDMAKQMIEAQINTITQELPTGVKITVEKMNPSILPVMGYSLEGDVRSLIELNQIAENTIKPFLSRINGVSEIAIIGGKKKEFKVILDPLKMTELGINAQSVLSTLSQSSFISSNGYLTDYNRLYLSLTKTSITGSEDIENIVISNSAKRLTLLKNIARIEISEKKEYVKISANGKDVPLIAVIKQPGANLIKLAQDVKTQVKELNTLLPKGVVIRPYYDQADFVNDSIKSLKDVLWIGLLLAILIMFLFLRSIKASSVVLITIPVTLALTVMIVYAMGYTLNIMTIGAIAAAIGLIIDDAIIVIEQIHRTHEEFPNESSYSLVGKSIKYLFPAMIGSSLCTIVIFLPFVFMSGVAGAYFKVMTNTMIITLVCSFFVTWLGLPVLYVLISGENHSIKDTGKEIKQRNWVGFFIRKPLMAVFISILLIGVSIFILPNLPSGFLPEMDEGSLVLDFNSPPGTSLEETDRILKNVDVILTNTPAVESFSRRVGTQMGFFITEPNRGDYLIQLKKNRKITTMELADELRKKIETTMPALTVDFGQVIGDMLGDLMSSTQPIEVKIYGDDHRQLKKIAAEVASVVEGVKGTADVFNGITVAGPEIIIKPHMDKLALYNISANDFQSLIQLKTDGNVVGNIIEKNSLTDIRLFENESKLLSVENLKKGNILLPNGLLKPISELADIRLTEGVAEIERENLKTMIPVTARLNQRDLGSTLKEIKSLISSKISLPPGFNIEYGGAYAEQQKAFNELLSILIMACFFVFIVILFLFRDIKIALLIILISVLGISGSFIALLLTNTPLNVGSYTGIIMIVGIIGENSIFTFQQYLKARKESSRDEAIIYSISTRLRPKLMTAFGAIFALLPLSFGIGTGAQMHQPLAVAIIGGLIIAIPLLLIVLPGFLRIIEKKEKQYD